MSTERDNGRLVFNCDECSEYAEDGEDLGFSEFWSLLKDDGWRCKKEADDWKHFCPECVKRFRS